MPKVMGIVSRDRLFKQLDKAREKPVIWIGAPAGSGKTALVASYLAAHKIRPLWYQIDTHDADPAAFFAYLRQAAGRLAPCKRETLPLLTPEYAHGLPVFTLNFFEQLFDRLHAQAVLVFDNFQDLPETSPLHNLIESLLCVLPDQVTLIFLSRSQSPPSFAHITAVQRLVRIEADSLRLTNEEALAISKTMTPKPVGQEEIEALNTRADGWTAGLILLLAGAGNNDHRTLDANLFNYFAAEIMHRTDPRTQAFLTISALLPVMDGRSTAKLTGHHRANELLEELLKRNYFIICLEGSPARYEFHPLFRAFLLAELEKRSSDEELRALHHKAGRILREQGEYYAAVELFCSADALNELQVLILAHAEQLVVEGQYATLHQWLELIPKRQYQDEPWLHYWYGVSRMPFDLLKACDCFECAYTLFEDQNDAVGLYLSWVGIAESYTMMWDDFSGMEPWLNRYENLRARFPKLPSLQLEIRVQTALFGVLIYLQKNQKHCRETCATLERFIDVEADPNLKIKLLSNLNLYYMWQGDFASASRICDTMERIIESEQVTPLSKIISSAGRSTVSYILGEPQAAKEPVIIALQLSQTTGIYLMHALIMSQLIYIHGMEEDLDKMQATLKASKPYLSPQCRLNYAHYLYQLAWYNSLMGEYDQAVFHARESVKMSRQTSAMVPTTLGELGLASYLIYLDEYEEAHALIDKALAFATSADAKFLIFEASLIRAYALLRQKDEKSCAIEVGHAFQQGMAYGYVTPSRLDRRMLVSICEFSLRKNIRSDYARLLIRKWQLVPKTATLTSDEWPWPVKINALGYFDIQVDNQSVITSSKRRNRAFELLKVIVSYGGQNVSEQQICKLLWPDAEDDLAHQNFKVTLHRLRKLIGQQAVLIHSGKLTLNADLVWTDIWAFEQLLEQLISSSDNELASLVRKVIEDYKGGLLPGESADWVLYGQEHLRERFLRVTDQAMERLCHLQQWRSAIDCYQKALENNPLAECFYVGLMRGYYELGQRADGLTVYHRCCETLANELQIQPSSITRAWHERLRNST
jgi:ATP/maltotriose-dependent transcriptional regulator MalT/DNA-binding SARP family transcriptional activator